MVVRLGRTWSGGTLTRPGKTSDVGSTPKTSFANGNDTAVVLLRGTGSKRMLSTRTVPPAEAFTLLLTIVNGKWTSDRSLEVSPSTARSEQNGVHCAGIVMNGVTR